MEILFLSNNQITDLTPLAGLKKLELLFLDNNNLTKAEVVKLQKALPKCKITKKEKKGKREKGGGEKKF